MDDDDIISEFASARESLHDGDPSGRQLTKQTHKTGLRGEFAFGDLVGIYPDTSSRRKGDGGVDFIVPLCFKVDVKTRRERQDRNGMYMLVEVGKLDADIYVCAILSEDERLCEIVGWQWGNIVERFPTGVLRDGIENYMVPVNKLRPIDELVKRVPNLRKIMKL